MSRAKWSEEPRRPGGRLLGDCGHDPIGEPGRGVHPGRGQCLLELPGGRVGLGSLSVRDVCIAARELVRPE